MMVLQTSVNTNTCVDHFPENASDDHLMRAVITTFATWELIYHH